MRRPNILRFKRKKHDFIQAPCSVLLGKVSNAEQDYNKEISCATPTDPMHKKIVSVENRSKVPKKLSPLEGCNLECLF